MIVRFDRIEKFSSKIHQYTKRQSVIIIHYMALRKYFKKMRYLLSDQWLMVAFCLFAAGFGSFFALSVPIGHGEDEHVNMYRAYSVSRGEFTTQILDTAVIDGKDVDYYGLTKVSTSLIDLEAAGNASRNESYCVIGSNSHPDVTSTDRHYNNAGCYQASKETASQRDEHSKESLSGGAGQTSTGGSSAYSFIAYIPGAIGFTIAQWFDMSAGGGVLLARLATLLFYIAVTALALGLLRDSKAKWLLFVAALLPGSLVLASAVNVDSVLLPLSFLLFALVVRGFKDRRLHAINIALLFAVAAILPILKAPYGVLSLAVLFLPIYASGYKGWLMRLATLAFIAIPALVFNVSVAHIDQVTSYAVNPDATHDGVRNLYWMFSQPLEFLSIFAHSFMVADWASGVNTLTHQRVRLPGFLNILSYILLFAAGVFAAQDFIKGKLRQRWPIISATLLAGVCAAVALPVLTVARGFVQPEIVAIQGRYFIPMLPFIFLSIGLLAGVKVKAEKAAAWGLLIAIMALLVLSAYWYFAQVYWWSA